MDGAKIRNLVITKLEERSAFLTDNNSGPILSGGDSLDELKPVYSYVDEQLPIAANEVLLSAPIHKLFSVKMSTPKVTPNDDGTGIIELPDDFLRLALLKMKEWSVPVHVAISADHPEYVLQFNRYTRGHKHKPVVVYNADEDMMQHLEYYSVSKDHTVDRLSYIKRFDLGDEYNDTVAELIALNCAKKIHEIYGNTELANLISSEIQNVQNVMLL
jgi:hypothetical protein